MGQGAKSIMLTREGYYTSPPIHQLKNYAECGIYTVEKLTIGRHDYGSITFEGPVNIKDMNFDDTVVINHKEVIVYPNDDEKPPAGRGLNCAAQVRLERIWPYDACTKKYITDPLRIQDMGFDKRLREANEKSSAKFVKYVPETGSWIFKVDHFSKYGYMESDSDEGDEAENTLIKGNQKKQKLKEVITTAAKTTATTGTPTTTIAAALSSPRARLTLDESPPSRPDDDLSPGVVVNWNPHATSRGLDRQSVIVETRSLMEDVEMTEVRPSPASIITHIADHWLKPLNASGEFEISPEKITAMKKTFFPEQMDTETDVPDVVPKTVKRVQSRDLKLQETPKTAPMTPSKAVNVETKLSPVEKEISEHEHQFKQRPLLQNITGFIKTVSCGPQRSSIRQNLIRINKDRNRGFRVGWGPGNVLLIVTTQKSACALQLEGKILDVDMYLQGRSSDDNSKEILQRISLKGGKGLTLPGRGRNCCEDDIRAYLVKHLNVKLTCSEFYNVNNVPGIKPSQGSKSISLHDCLSQNDKSDARDYVYSVWSLCNALWGELLESVPPVNSHHNLMLRKKYLGNWITSIYRKSILNKYCAKLFGSRHENSDRYIEDIWNLVTVNMIPDACNLARKNADPYLAILLTQLASSQRVSNLIREQITSWIDCEADVLIRRERLKIYLLLCNTPLFTAREETLNVCEDLDWKRTLGLHLWYLTSGVHTIKDAFVKYQKAFNPEDFRNLYAKAPVPPYCDETYAYDEKPHTLDLCYQIIDLYCDRFASMTKMFDPITHTLDMLDYSLSWFVYSSLQGIGYHHTSVYGSSHVHSSFAAQLESYGLWEWAVFVLLHIPDTTSRRTAVMCMLERHLDCDTEGEEKEKECFIKSLLQIPDTWIYSIKANRALAEQKYQSAVFYLNKAGNVSLSLNILMKHLAPQFLINECYCALLKLLKPIEERKGKEITVAKWEKTGFIIWLYLKVMTKIKYMLKYTDTIDGYHLESVQVDAIDLCKRLSNLDVPTLMHRLCRLDLSNRIFDLVGEFVKLQKDDPMSSRIILYMSTKLPMQDNFKVFERKDFLTKWPADFANCRLFS